MNTEGIIKETETMQFNEFAKVVINWMAKNSHPHASLLCNNIEAELVEGVQFVVDESYVVD